MILELWPQPDTVLGQSLCGHGVPSLCRSQRSCDSWNPQGSALLEHNSCKTPFAPHPEPWQCDHHCVQSSTDTELHRIPLGTGTGTTSPQLWDSCELWPHDMNTTFKHDLLRSCWALRNLSILPGAAGEGGHAAMSPKVSATGLACSPPALHIQWNNNISPGLTPWPVWIICFRKTWNHLLYPT